MRTSTYLTRHSSDHEIERILQSYPKVRPPLPAPQQAIYAREYEANRSGQKGLFRLVTTLETWMHRTIAGSARGNRILELGAGTLNHLSFENAWTVYDVVEPFRQLYEGRPEREKITRIFEDIRQVPAEVPYDRILSIAVLEHLTDLPAVVARSALLLAPNGSFQAAIPSEGGLLWALGWRLTTGVAYRFRTGLDYGDVMRHEHVNTANEIITVLNHFFSEVKVRRFPFPWHNLSFYTVLDAAGPRREHCREFLSLQPQ